MFVFILFMLSCRFLSLKSHEKYQNQLFSQYRYEYYTVAPRYNEPRYNEDPVITNNIWKSAELQ